MKYVLAIIAVLLISSYSVADELKSIQADYINTSNEVIRWSYKTCLPKLTKLECLREFEKAYPNSRYAEKYRYGLFISFTRYSDGYSVDEAVDFNTKYFTEYVTPVWRDKDTGKWSFQRVEK